jgi:hypothetical protein
MKKKGCWQELEEHLECVNQMAREPLGGLQSLEGIEDHGFETKNEDYSWDGDGEEEDLFVYNYMISIAV